MYRVAVLLNESETQRYGWASIIPVLQNSVDHHEYAFQAFTSANVAEFLQRHHHYDSLFISYNACNDELLYSSLVTHRNIIADFLNSGRGLFVCFQKRLADAKTISGFLPPEYEYQILGRQEPSREGVISIPTASKDSILLRFPKRIVPEEVLYRCRNNDFKEHIYRGSLIPENKYNYVPLMVDDSYGSPRDLILASRYDFRARVILSTIPLDWEGHLNLLSNIIVFITEGVPMVACVGKRNSDVLDYDYLVWSLKFHKVSGRTYWVDTLEDQTIRTDIHKFYVLGPGWTEDECSAYWKRVSKTGQDCRVYSFKRTAGVPSLVEYSTFAFSDRLIAESVAWLNSRFSNGRFQTSFWITRDVLEMLRVLGLPLDSVRDEILRRTRAHDTGGSYDNLMGSSCALIEICSWLLGRDTVEYRRSLRWINDNFGAASRYEQQTAILTLAKLKEPYVHEVYRDIYNRLCEIPRSSRLQMSEVDLCRNAEVCLLEEPESALEWVDVLAELQRSDGRWTNTARTATALNFLLANMNSLVSESRMVDRMIAKGISFLCSEFGRSGSCWNGDALATAKAAQALKLFQCVLEYPVEEAFLSIRGQQHAIANTRSSEYANFAIDGIRKELAVVKLSLDKQAQLIDRYRKTKKRFEAGKTLVMLEVVVFAALAVYIFHKERWHDIAVLLNEFVRDLRVTIPAVILFLVGTWLHVRFIRMEEKMTEDKWAAEQP